MIGRWAAGKICGPRSKMASWPIGQASACKPDQDGSIPSDVFGFHGDYSVVVNTRDCGPRKTGSSPVSHPCPGGMAQSGRRTSFRCSFLRVRLPLPPSDGVAQLERAPGREPDGWQFESARYHCQVIDLETGQRRLTAKHKREDLEMRVRLPLLAYPTPQPGQGGMAQSGRRASMRYSFLRVQVPLPPFQR